MKYSHIVVGLGNPTKEYANTRHNIGFRIADALAEIHDAKFQEDKYGFVATYKTTDSSHNDVTVFIIKPNTFMNNSGTAVKYWFDILNKNNLNPNIIVIQDDIHLPFGKWRVKNSGSSGGHNGIKDIIEKNGSDFFDRVKFGVGNNFADGKQIDYVLSNFTKEEENIIKDKLQVGVEIIDDIIENGSSTTISKMGVYNNKK